MTIKDQASEEQSAEEDALNAAYGEELEEVIEDDADSVDEEFEEVYEGDTQLDEFQATGDPSSVADPVTPAGGGDKKRRADKSNGDSTTPPKIKTPGTKSGAMSAIMNKLNGMKQGDVVAMYKKMANAASQTPSRLADKRGAGLAVHRPSPLFFEDVHVDVTEDFTNLFEKTEGLDEEFAEKALVIVEAAVNARVTTEVAALNEQQEDKFDEAVEEIREELVGKVDKYLGYVVEKWMEENTIAIENGIRTEITEQFMEGLKDLFAENYIEVPSERLDVVEDLVQKIETLEEKLEKSISENIDYKNREGRFNMDEIFDGFAEGLTDTQQEKFYSLAEGVEYVDDEDYKKKLSIIKENYFSDGIQTMVENSDVEDTPLEEVGEGLGDVEELTPTMQRYVDSIGDQMSR